MHARLIRFLDHLSSGGIPGQHLVSSSSSNPASTLTPTAGAGAGGDVLLLPTGAESSEYEETVTSLPELEEELQVVYGSAEQLLDYHRVSRPTYC